MTFTRTTIGLLAAALIIVGLNIYVFQAPNQKPDTIEGAGEPAVPGLSGREAEIDRIVLSGPEGTTTLLRQQTGWVVEEKGGFPAAGNLVADLILGLADARKFEPRTAEDRFFERLGLTDRFVDISAYSGPQAFPPFKTGDQFFSPTGEGVLTFGLDPATGRAWTYSGLPEISIDPVFWMSRDLLALSDLRIKSLEVRIGDEPAWELVRQDPMASDFVLRGTAPALLNQATVNGAALAAMDVNFEDVTEGPVEGILQIATARFETFDGLSVVMTLFDQDGIILTALEAGFDENAVLAADAPAVMYDVPADGAAEAEMLNRLWQGRLFQIPIQKLAAFIKFRNEFLAEQAP